MEEFLLEHGNVIISGIVAVISIVLISMVIWFIGKITILSLDQIVGVCL